ncbi:MAG: hypothetical protein R3192_06470 [Woeseiaceae bacterium]|nr:hypothetical protein [Woeseiaceae bacterium]
MKLGCRLLIAITFIASGSPLAAAERHATLDAWLAKELTPYLREQLQHHPRFKGEALKFVVMDNGVPQATSNTLALRLRDRLRDSVADVPGIRLAWQAGDPRYQSAALGIDCTRTEVHYLVGIEMQLLDRGSLAVELLAVDLEERSKVPGFGRAWRGSIGAREYRALRLSEADPAFRGEREVPYDETQGDLLAAHLAHELGCSLLRQTEAEYVIAGSLASEGGEPPQRVVELVGNNLARYSTLQFAASDEAANAIITGKAHRIDDDLYQYWITVQPKDANSEIHALSASAYLRIPEKYASAELITGPQEPALHSSPGFLGSLRVVELRQSAECSASNSSNARQYYGRRYGGNDECFALAVRSSDDAVVFFLHHQLNNGLVRLAGASCLPASNVKVAKSKQQVSFVLPEDLLSSAAWSGADWQLYPDRDTFYAIAATDNKAARELSKHIRRLPYRCTSSVRPGLEGADLERWMDELKATVDKWGQEIHWQGIRVKNVY